LVITLADEIVIRQENFGAILFHKRRGTIIEIDKEAYEFIRKIQIEKIIDIHGWEQENVEELNSFIQHLVKEEFFIVLSQGALKKKDNTYSPKRVGTQEKKIYLSAPETVHLAVTFRCENTCRDCYIERHKNQIKNEMSTKQIYRVINQISDLPVFQIAVGGGEPLLRGDIVEILSYAYHKNLIIHLTSGKHDISEELLNNLSRYLTVLQIGIRNKELLETQGEDTRKSERIVRFMKDREKIIGANIVVDRYCIEHFDRILEAIVKIGFQTITFLRYKPSANTESWNTHNPTYSQMMKFKQLLTKAARVYSEIMFRIDCSFTFLEKDLGTDMAQSRGIRGCVAGSRIISIVPDGGVYPCSQLVGRDYYSGNVLKQSLKEIWENSEALMNQRNYRSNVAFLNSKCGKCKAKEYCGACMVFQEVVGGAAKYCMKEGT